MHPHEFMLNQEGIVAIRGVEHRRFITVDVPRNKASNFLLPLEGEEAIAADSDDEGGECHRGGSARHPSPTSHIMSSSLQRV